MQVLNRIWQEEVVILDDTKTRIMSAAMKAVRQYGLEGVRIQNVSELAGISPGALYRYFDGKEQLIIECFTYVDRQAAAIFEHVKFNPIAMFTGKGAVAALFPVLDIAPGRDCLLSPLPGQRVLPAI